MKTRLRLRVKPLAGHAPVGRHSSTAWDRLETLFSGVDPASLAYDTVMNDYIVGMLSALSFPRGLRSPPRPHPCSLPPPT